MKIKALFAAVLLGLALVACQPTPGGGDGSQSQPSQAAPSGDAAAPGASGSPYQQPGY
jgi:hypothetical protein